MAYRLVRFVTHTCVMRIIAQGSGYGSRTSSKIRCNYIDNMYLPFNGKKDLKRLIETNNMQSAAYHMADLGERKKHQYGQNVNRVKQNCNRVC